MLQRLKFIGRDLKRELKIYRLVYKTQGKSTQAEPLFKRSLAIKEKTLGPEHPSVATSLENMAVLYRKMNRDKEAQAFENGQHASEQ